ncbi:FAD-dependent oxidoreductase [Spirosoma panaciterrae]|uniref:FAD-dependent oxidoreductase n=1 Tax=Spirosoma panaciterrae TaxID=496058 RepID=UPI0003687A61|nr:FAD-dependent oxidoreductase [Spirosoma panaciterrae]
MIADYTESPVCHVNDLVDGELKLVRVGDTDVLLARTDGQFYALHPQCTHYHGPLVEGVLNGHRLICPWHNACFDVRNGHRLEAPALNGLPTHEVRIEQDQVFVRVTTNKESLENPMATPDEANTETYVIVGGGAAGAFAAEAMREGGFTGKIIMLTESDQFPYDRPNCSKEYLQDAAPDEWMPLRPEDFYADFGIEIRTNQRVTVLDPIEKRIELASGETLTYDKVLVCPGGQPNTLPGLNPNLKGVYTLRSMYDSQHLRDLGKQGKRFVIVGSSFIGLEGAMSLRKLGSEIDVVGPDSVPFRKILGEKIGRVVQKWHEDAGIRFHLGRKVDHLEGEDTVQTVVLDNGDRLPADVVLLGLGVKPRTDFLLGISLETDGGISTDGNLNSMEGLYAAGDIVHYPTADGSQRIEHWRVACQQGHVAGLNMAGQQTPYLSAPFFWTDQQGHQLAYVGHTTAIDDIIYDGDPEKDDSFLALYIQQNQIRAAAGLQRDQDIIAIRELMEEGRMPTVDEVRNGIDWVKTLKKA